MIVPSYNIIVGFKIDFQTGQKSLTDGQRCGRPKWRNGRLYPVRPYGNYFNVHECNLHLLWQLCGKLYIKTEYVKVLSTLIL